jgi:hypothetical protein
MKKLDYGIKVSKRGFNVIDLNQEPKENKDNSVQPHMEYVLALPYLYGAKMQVTRFQAAALTLKQNPSGSVITCIHEVSTLFEDLSTVSRYVEKCGNKHDFHKLIRDVRNHIRHDTRDNYDDESDFRKKDRAKRAKRLKLDPKLQTSMGFSLDLIKVGDVEIEIKEVISYLNWAEGIVAEVMKKAKDSGKIS